MTVINEERKTYNSCVYTLWNDTTPASLELDKDDLGLQDNIAVGSFLLTPAKRYIYGEGGSFIELGW